MTSNKHDFEELDTPAAAAEKLGISVATLRKYSLIVEKVTGNKDYFERSKQRARLYHKKDIDDLDDFHNLSKTAGLTLEEAARQIYAVSDKKTADKRREAKSKPKNELMDSHQVAKLLGALQQTIANQNEAIDRLQKQLNRIEKQNQDLLQNQKQLEAPKDIDDKIAAMPDISGIVTEDDEKEESQDDKRQKVLEDKNKSEEELHDEIINKAKENAKKRAKANVHRTLEDMQLHTTKKHWWQRLF